MIAKWTKNRATKRLEQDLAAALRRECECDAYVGFTCGKHHRIQDLEQAIAARKPPAPAA